ncbi:hypothetical protein EMIT093MI4_230007 [Pseudomonas sp. IT-93MI4]
MSCGVPSVSARFPLNAWINGYGYVVFERPLPCKSSVSYRVNKVARFRHADVVQNTI